jgi:hypothetical protein
MTQLMAQVVDSNSLAKVVFRESITKIQNGLLEAIAAGVVPDTLGDCTVKHYFTPIDDKFGCYTYAREMFIPRDTVIIGKLHRHQHLNIISQGSVAVVTEHGTKRFVGPCAFVSEVGTKRAVYAEEGTMWTTLHTVSYGREEDLDKIEDEVIAPSYNDLNLISTVKELEIMLQLKANKEATMGGVV